MKREPLQTVTANINVHLEHRYKRLILTSPLSWGTQENLLSFDIATYHSNRHFYNLTLDTYSRTFRMGHKERDLTRS